jgi:hypothetical protein
LTYSVSPIKSTHHLCPQLINQSLTLIHRAFHFISPCEIPCNFIFQFSSLKLFHFSSLIISNGLWLNHQKLLNIGLSVSIWSISYMYNNCSQHLINPLPTVLQWLSVEIVSTSIVIVRFILVLLYATKAITVSKLVILVRFENNINLKISQVSIMPFSLTNQELFFLLSNTSSIIFHFRLVALIWNFNQFSQFSYHFVVPLVEVDFV